jgi:hypothetical protein
LIEKLRKQGQVGRFKIGFQSALGVYPSKYTNSPTYTSSEADWKLAKIVRNPAYLKFEQNYGKSKIKNPDVDAVKMSEKSNYVAESDKFNGVG